MPRLIITALEPDIEEAMNKTEGIAREVFGREQNSILPMDPESVEMIPNPVDHIFSKEQRIVNILLHQKEDRPQEKLDAIARAFKTNTTIVKVNTSPEELWRKF